MSGISDLVSTEWLAAHLRDPDLRILDGSWWMPNTNHDPLAEWKAAHIPGARFFDIDKVADTSVPLPHMLPSEKVFADALAALGIGEGNHVVVYDAAGVFASPRVWWTFRAFGFEAISVLDGGLPKWRREGHLIVSGDLSPVSPPALRFTPKLDRRWVRTLDVIRANIDSGKDTVIDARSAGRFAAAEPEPRPGLRGGHIPNSLNLPFQRVIDPASGTLLPPADLTLTFAEAGLEGEKPAVFTCGSGLTASILALALHRLGREPVAVYDGSWSEWGARDDVPVSTGV
jgi:thiosulfate/3-mercaptopyruvate sulfurtransferase